MKYIYIPDGETAYEVQPEKDPLFPGVSIKKRFSTEYLNLCVKVTDDIEVEAGWILNKENTTFAEPTPPPLTEVSDDSEKVSPEVIENRIEALETELTALRQQLAEKETEKTE